MRKTMEKVKLFLINFRSKLAIVSSETIGWIANVVLHCATLPSLIAVSMGLSDKLPSIDLVLLIWSALTLLFVRSIISKDMINIITIGVGFIVQAVLMATIFFK